MNIDRFNQVLTETNNSLLGYRKNRKEEWIKTDTWKTIDERKETKKNIKDTKSQRIKNQLQARYSTLDKEVKRKTKADKRAFIENLADEAETAAQMQNMATLYKITKALAGGFKNCDIPMKDADGVVNNKCRRTNTTVENALRRDHPVFPGPVCRHLHFPKLNNICHFSDHLTNLSMSSCKQNYLQFP